LGTAGHLQEQNRDGLSTTDARGHDVSGPTRIACVLVAL
jgi:hypothetical protein